MEEKKKQSRKKYGSESEQKMFSFRLDKRLWAWLNSKPNKGRYLNNLINQDMKSAWNGGYEFEPDAMEHPEALDSPADYLT